MKKTSVHPNTEIYDLNRGRITSSKGGWKIGKGVVCHGFNMMEDLVGKKSYLQVVILNATGVLPSRALANWFEAVYICLSWPDSRIWCNQIGALGGSVRSSALASTVAGVLSADARSYGVKPIIAGIEFIQEALTYFKNGEGVESIIKRHCDSHGGKPNMMGYARPIAKGDERVPALDRVRIDQGFEIGEHLTLALAIDKYLKKHFDETININGYVSAFLSDQHFSSTDVYRIFSVVVASGVTACYIDARNKPAESFLTMRCDDIDYQGHASRKVPDIDY